MKKYRNTVDNREWVVGSVRNDVLMDLVMQGTTFIRQQHHSRTVILYPIISWQNKGRDARVPSTTEYSTFYL